MSARAEIDPNVRIRDNQTFVGFDDCEGTIEIGTPIEVWERESDVVGPGVVSGIDLTRRLVYIRVLWRELRVRQRARLIVHPRSAPCSEETV